VNSGLLFMIVSLHLLYRRWSWRFRLRKTNISIRKGRPRAARDGSDQASLYFYALHFQVFPLFGTSDLGCDCGVGRGVGIG
jgi:hypothetical protein